MAKHTGKGVQYTVGTPTRTLKIEQWKKNIEEEDIDEFSMMISENLKLSNFQIVESNSKN
jgi:hypothetical protein